MVDQESASSDDDGETSEAWTEIGNSHESINSAVTNSIRKAILSGKLAPGERLTEIALAKTFGVSRNPVREALRVLEVEGIVEINPRKGARVVLLSTEEIQEIIELRAELEGMSAKYAARRCTLEARTTLQDLLDKGNEAVEQNDIGRLVELNVAFHGAVAKAGKNRFLAGFMKTLNEKTQWIFASRPVENIADNWNEHAAILQAIISADEELSAVLAKRHVEDIGKEITGASEDAG